MRSRTDRIFLCVGDFKDDVAQPESQEDEWDSVVNIYQNGVVHDDASPSLTRILAYVTRLLHGDNYAHPFHRLPSASSLLAPLNSILASERASDTVSGEIVELLGFDEINLVMDILCNRQAVSREVAISTDAIALG